MFKRCVSTEITSTLTLQQIIIVLVTRDKHYKKCYIIPYVHKSCKYQALNELAIPVGVHALYMNRWGGGGRAIKCLIVNQTNYLHSKPEILHLKKYLA